AVVRRSCGSGSSVAVRVHDTARRRYVLPVEATLDALLAQAVGLLGEGAMREPGGVRPDGRLRLGVGLREGAEQRSVVVFALPPVRVPAGAGLEPWVVEVRAADGLQLVVRAGERELDREAGVVACPRRREHVVGVAVAGAVVAHL